jgi:cobalt-zinc-cadmium efflux system protein
VGHPHTHHADHDHGHHSAPGHDQGHGASARRLLIAFGILLTFTVIEALGGAFANSIALLAEAAHMLADCGSLLLAVFAVRASRRPPDARHTYGSSRYQTLAAYTNGLILLGLTVAVTAEALRRLIAPPPVDGRLMLLIALLGGGANFGAFLALSGARSLNERSARAHVLSDLLGSAAAAGAALLIFEFAWRVADPLFSLLVSALILRSGWQLTREAGHVLLQGAPHEIDPEDIAHDLEHLPGVRNIHHLHVWSMTGDAPVVTLHAMLESADDPQSVLKLILERLRDRHAITHATVQLEGGTCPDPSEHRCHRA